MLLIKEVVVLMDKKLEVKKRQLAKSVATFKRAIFFAFMGCSLLTVNLPTHAQQSDLSTSSDMVESSLSMSLNAQAITIDDETVFISVSQFGLNNITNIIQSGNGANLSNVVQNGSNNEALITQLGEGTSLIYCSKTTITISRLFKMGSTMWPMLINWVNSLLLFTR